MKFTKGDIVVYVKHHHQFGCTIPLGRIGEVYKVTEDKEEPLPYCIKWEDREDYDHLAEFEIAPLTKLHKALR